MLCYRRRTVCDVDLNAVLEILIIKFDVRGFVVRFEKFASPSSSAHHNFTSNQAPGCAACPCTLRTYVRTYVRTYYTYYITYLLVCQKKRQLFFFWFSYRIGNLCDRLRHIHHHRSFQNKSFAYDTGR